MSHLTAWFDRRIIDVLLSEANQKWAREALWASFSALPGEWVGVGIAADRNIGWGQSPTVLASKVPKFQPDLQLSHGPC
jgi:hypothetical protein